MPKMDFKDKRIVELEKELQKIKEKKRLSKKQNRKTIQNLTHFFFALFFGKKLKKNIEAILEELKQGKIKQETKSELLANIFIRFTRIGVFAIIAFLIPTIFLIIQTNILSKQNKLFKKQNEKVDIQNRLVTQQNQLAESNRRSSLIFLFSNIMDKVDEELKDKNNINRELSGQLIGRIIALTNSFKPYQYLVTKDSLSPLISPERGQLLITLINSNLHQKTYDSIFNKALFIKSDLIEANLEGSYLVFAELENANFERAYLENVNFGEAGLEGANFEGAYLGNANLREAELKGANFKGAIVDTNFFSRLDTKNLKYIEERYGFIVFIDKDLNRTFYVLKPKKLE